ARTSGNPATKRRKYGLTVATCVCCSMISDSQTRYGSPVPCHGKSWRPWAPCQAMRRAAKLRVIATALALAEALARLLRRFGLRILRDQLFERTARGGVVVQIGLRRCDVEERIRHLVARRIDRDQRALRGDRRAKILARVVRVADPILRRR